ncbi:PRD domain-containing protein [Bacillus sp. V33-4]|uniref:PRD domain-containing protein n=1 Tax=Bacillus sp. V33-4 TaxID=2054169 RepID=UPI000C7603FA|nr:PRD domain-containing protein [Bacillus sp. V33-4]PLR80611.1 PRD domain-containing protein [Bacillus sp. V33-4]
MIKEELDERLKVLQLSETITNTAAIVTKNAFEHLTSTLKREQVLQGEMLFTHLPMALTRLARGEKIEQPPEAVVNEALSSGFKEKTNNEIFNIEQQWGSGLPEAEKDYLYIHYSLIFQLNSGGEAK